MKFLVRVESIDCIQNKRDILADGIIQLAISLDLIKAFDIILLKMSLKFSNLNIN
mgnify:CR=1 FL=1